MKQYIKTYAQNREDIILSAFFDNLENGFYVDVGANHPVIDSVTKLFYDKGWTGINIEPNPNYIDMLNRERPKDTNLNLGVSSNSGNLSLRVYDDGDGLSTMSDEIKKGYMRGKVAAAKKFHDIEVPVLTLAEIFGQHQVAQISFMKVDVEGYEYYALAGNDWDRFRPEVLCIEANHVTKDWRPLLKENGYRKVFNDGLNDYYVSVESGRQESFKYVEKVIGHQIIDYRIYNELEELEAEVMAKKCESERILERVKEKEHEINRLNVYIYEHQKVRLLVRDLAKAIDRAISVRLKERSKRKKYYPVIDAKAKNIKNAAELLVIIGEADSQAVYSKQTVQAKLRVIIFTAVFATYRYCKKLLRRSIRILRKLKNLMR